MKRGAKVAKKEPWLQRGFPDWMDSPKISLAKGRNSDTAHKAALYDSSSQESP